jgi:DNA/RNA-binding domain of Phe-tRNA-synthetase-like protein
MATFLYHPAIIERFPTVVGGVILAQSLRNGPADATLTGAYQAEQQVVRQRLGTTPLSELPTLAAWRRVFSGFGVAPTQYRSAAEALLRRLTKQGELPSINTLVDLGNLVSIRYALPVAVFDLRGAAGPITVRFADGSERFQPLGQPAPETPEAGEVIFADPTGQVQARRWCWRQSEPSAARADTTDAVITVEAHHAGARADIQAAIDDLMKLLAAYAGGQLTSSILDRETAD